MVEKITGPDEKNLLVERISKDPLNSFAVYGIFEEFGFYHKTSSGPNVSEIKKALKLNETAYTSLFEGNFSGPEFKAKVAKVKDGNNNWFFLVFNDRQFDKRGACHTDFILVIPKGLNSDAIEADPDLMIKIFQKIYPDYDRSEGKLMMDEKNEKVISLPKEEILTYW